MAKICDWYKDNSCDCFCNGLNIYCENYSGDLCTDKEKINKIKNTEDLIMYYDVVCSVYEESEDELDYRVDSHLLCGGFETEDEAMKCIEDGKFSLIPYYNRCKDNEIACIEIEKREDETGNLIDIISVD